MFSERVLGSVSINILYIFSCEKFTSPALELSAWTLITFLPSLDQLQLPLLCILSLGASSGIWHLIWLRERLILEFSSWTPLLLVSQASLLKILFMYLSYLRKMTPLRALVGGCSLGAAVLLSLLLQCGEAESSCAGTVPMKWRREVISITDFGAVGDGRTLNTWPFKKAIYRIQHMRHRGGTLLYVPSGVWLTGGFSLTSHMTLFLAKGAVIKATQDTRDWPLVDPLPSYGRGRELPGKRYMSFIQGDGISDVIITGENGTIDGQGELWWNMWRERSLHFTRPNLLELKNSRDVLISNVIFQNSPFWNIHPVYCSNVVIKHVTVLAPHDSPNTDGIDPDSSSNVCIEDAHISTGDDMVAIKSGWDEYGIAYGRPSSGITVRRLTGSSPFSGIAIGSETSGGIENVLVESVILYDTGIGVHIKTNVGRGGLITNVTVTNVSMERVGTGIRIAGDVGDHPDEEFDRFAVPRVDGVTIKDVWGVGVQQPGSMQGIKGAPFTRICLSNVRLRGGAGGLPAPWKCGAVSGVSIGVQPGPCTELAGTFSAGFCSGSL